MNRFKKWLLKSIFKREVIQGYNHNERIINLYKMIHDAVKNEFNEDNVYTRNDYLTEWFEKSLTKPKDQIKPTKLIHDTLQCGVMYCTNEATHYWSGHPTCDDCGTPNRKKES